MTCPSICDSRPMKKSSSRGTVALPASSSDLRRKRNGSSIGSNITRNSCVASRRHASPFALARESHFETCGESTAAGIEAVPTRRPCQGRSPAGVERSESLDAGEHRVIVDRSGRCGTLFNGPSFGNDAWPFASPQWLTYREDSRELVLSVHVTRRACAVSTISPSERGRSRRSSKRIVSLTRQG